MKIIIFYLLISISMELRHKCSEEDAEGVVGEGKLSCCGCCWKEQQLSEFDSLSRWCQSANSADISADPKLLCQS